MEAARMSTSAPFLKWLLMEDAEEPGHNHLEQVRSSTSSPDLMSLLMGETEVSTYNLTNMDNSTIPVEAQWRITLYLTSTIVLTCNTIFLMLGMGSAINWLEMWTHLRRPVGAVIGMVGQFVVLPAMGFLFAVLFKMRPYEVLGVLVISCSPGGSLSNFITYWADGDLALSIVMTACSSLLAFVGMPFNLWMYSRYWLNEDDEDNIVVPFRNIIMSLAFITLPVVVGMIIRHFSERAAGIITKVASMLGWLGVLIIFVIWVILYGRSFVIATPLIYAAAFLLPITGFTLAYAIAKLTCRSHKVCRTIGIETGCQNMPVALSVISLSFPEHKTRAQIVIFPTLYGLILILEVFLGIFSFKMYMKRCSSQDQPDVDVSMTYTAKTEKGTAAEKQLAIVTS
ncbi:hypothetical protein OTU49_010081 [Cherax quadricarinatus]|uniref:Ileal sodium/bile acid cotransporter n=2 Tax=Cherax quadricarinatus TaxID=27406 RepID=A0AAW0W9I6_CHEQU